MPIKTMLYGGAFNPVHVAHRAAAIHCLNWMAAKHGYEELWFLPCHSDAFGIKDMEAPHHRVAMLERTLEGIGDVRFRICTEEIDTANNAGTYAVVRRLIKAYPGREFTYLIGSDQAGLIRRWRNSRKLIMTVPFTVVTRTGMQGYRFSYWYRRGPHFFIDKTPMKKPVSSTSIRQDFKGQWDVWETEQHNMLLESVQAYIIEHGLYKGKIQHAKLSSEY
jgi:nicotinate-nucleotide adenylyltransferase